MHRGVALGDGRVLHNTPFRGEHIATEAEFSAGQRVYVTRLDHATRQSALARAERHGDGYHLSMNNCEHTVSRTVTGDARSPQLRGILGGLAAGSGVCVDAAPRCGGGRLYGRSRLAGTLVALRCVRVPR